MPGPAFPGRTGLSLCGAHARCYKGDPMKSTQLRNPRRRTLLKAAAGLGGMGLGASVLSLDALAQGAPKTTINLQLGWLPGNHQIGEVVARQLGYYAQEGLDVQIQPGGPNIDGVAIVASGRFEAGQL